MIRVGFFIGAHRRFTGSQRSLWLLVRGLRGTSIEPIVILPGEGVCAEKFRALGVRVVVAQAPDALGEFGGGLIRAGLARRALVGMTALAPYTLALTRLFRRERLDILHANDSRGLLLAGPAARLCQIPTIWHVRGDVRSLGSIYLHACGALATCIITVADGIHDSIPARFAAKITTIYNGIDAEVAVPRRTRASLTGAGSGLLVVAVGSLVPFKGAHHLIEAARFLGPQVSVVFVGDRPDRDYAHFLDERSAGLANVHFAGWDDEPADWFHAADVVCLPTVAHEVLTLGGTARPIHGTEGFSRTVLEAMAHGRAIVASRVAGVPEQIVDGESGVLVPPSDPLALSGALARLASDPALRARLGAYAKARVAERFSIARMVDSTTRVYRELTKRA